MFSEGDLKSLLYIASRTPRPVDRARLRLIASKVDAILKLPDEDKKALELAREKYRAWLAGTTEPERMGWWRNWLKSDRKSEA